MKKIVGLKKKRIPRFNKKMNATGMTGVTSRTGMHSVKNTLSKYALKNFGNVPQSILERLEMTSTMSDMSNL